MNVERISGTDPAARAVVAAMVAEVGAVYDAQGLPKGPTARPEELSPPHGGFVVLTEDGRTLAGGGVKRLADGICELKRMYVVREARGRGLGRELLAALEALARDLGYAVARLDTGARQPEAQRLYETAGYRSIGDYNANPYAAFWGEKALGA